jgi:carbohydrate diacid regulator
LIIIKYTETAREINAHRNTLLYRLEKHKQFTGIDPRKFNEAIQLYLALKMKHFQEK